MELVRLEGMIGLLARGFTHKIPVGIISTPNINMKDMVNHLINGNDFQPHANLSALGVNRMYEKKVEYISLKELRVKEITNLKESLKNILESSSYTHAIECMSHMKTSPTMTFNSVQFPCFKKKTNSSMFNRRRNQVNQVTKNTTIIIQKLNESNSHKPNDKNAEMKSDGNGKTIGNGNNDGNGKSKYRNSILLEEKNLTEFIERDTF